VIDAERLRNEKILLLSVAFTGNNNWFS
jgi:hypothetical protein